MIYNDNQYRITSDQLAKLNEQLKSALEQNMDDRWIRSIEIDAIKSQIEELEADLVHYKMLKSGKISVSRSHSFQSLPNILVQARIACSMSQSELATKLGVTLKDVQQYEDSGYMGISLDHLTKVAHFLNVEIVGSFVSEATDGNMIFSWENSESIRWKEFPSREMIRRQWFDLPREGDIIEATKKYFTESIGSNFTLALHRKKMRGDDLPNEYALLAWQSRVFECARRIIEKKEPAKFTLDDRWISELVALTRRSDGPRRARNLLARKGIILVVEKHLPGTYLDGAAMLGPHDHPVIGLTLRYDRLDNFWFVLLHELAHIYIHLFQGVCYHFFDDDTARSVDVIELEADEFALNALIPENKWESSLSRFALSEEAVRLDAQHLNVAESILAGRIRREQNNYTILNGLIQSGVSQQFRGDS